MEHIREALEKAKASDSTFAFGAKDRRAELLRADAEPKQKREPQPAGLWDSPEVALDPAHLERHRIVSFSKNDPNHVAFNILRTKVRKAMADNGWSSLAITSPTAECGKTMVGINLALSLSRGGDLRVALIDLDLKRPSLARTLGISPSVTIGQFLTGEAAIQDCFVRIAPELVVGLNNRQSVNSSELLQSARMTELMKFIETTLAPDIVLFDLPPMGTSDDVLTFLPYVDSMLLVAAAGATTVAEVDECERQLSFQGKFFGVVLNKGEKPSKDYYY